MTDELRTADFPAVKAAHAAAVGKLSYYRKMMETDTMTDDLPPLPAHPVARAYDRSGHSYQIEDGPTQKLPQYAPP